MTRPRDRLIRGLIAILLTGVWAAETRAVDVPLTGKRLVIVQTLTRERLVMVSRDTVPAPTEDGTDDPTLTGATLTLVNPSTLEGTTFDMPAANWSLNRTGTRYRYRNRMAPEGPSGVRLSVLRSGRVLKIVSRDVGISLDEATQGSIGLSLTMGTTTYCTLFGGTVRRDQPGRFIAKNADPPGFCPGLGGTTTTTLPGGTTSTTVPGATTSTTIIGGTTTTTTIPPGPCCNGAQFLSFTTADAPGDCGDITSFNGTLFGQLECSGLYFGGGGNSVPLPATIPDLGVSILNIASCAGQTATLASANAAETGNLRTCSDTSCLFGAPLAIANANSTPTSTCVINTVAAPADGSLDCATGNASIDMPLTSEVFLTGDLDGGTAGIQPCPRCVGTCISGPNAGEACTPGSNPLSVSYPTSHDCPPPASLSLGGLPIGFALTTGVVSWTATAATNDTETIVNQARVFAGYCRNANTLAFANPAQKCWENGVGVGAPCAEPFQTCEQRTLGAFGPNGGGVRTITAIGSPLAGILAGPATATLASIFGVPPTFNAIVDAAGNLPGPGATTLPGTGELCETVDPCVPPVVPTTTTLPGATTTSTTLSTTTSTVALTTTSTSTTTTSTLFPGCPPPGTPAGAVTFVTEAGSPECGGPGLVPAPQAPFSGAVLDGGDNVIADLGAGCLYVGGGLANSLPPPPAPDGAEAILNVDTANGTALTLAASDGDGLINCTRGAGPARHCVNGAPGTDTNGACTTDADCGQGSGNCLLDANCFFGPPIPLSPASPALATCLVNTFMTDVCGALDLGTATSSLQFGLSTRLYLTQNPADPCPRCDAGVCTAGERAGLACSTGVGSNGTSNECPPLASTYVGELFSNPIQVSTGTSELVADAEGNFCPNQQTPGALGTGPTGRTIQQTGALSGGGSLLATRFAGNICAASSGNPLVDSVEDLPGPVSLSFSGTLGVCVLPTICDTLCNPCNLGPLCGTICEPCLTCL